MKRKLRIFSNIAIICLSVCMFAFGVYAASTVSVTTSGTVTFNATDVYASITRTVTGAKSLINDVEQDVENITKEFNSTYSETNNPFAMGEEEHLVFEDVSTPIVMTFEITNLATDRNIDFSITQTKDTESKNVNEYYVVSANEYKDGAYNINPLVTGVKNVETITITFKVIDANKSAELDYNYSINMTCQSDVSTAIEEGSSLRRYGNTYVLDTALATSNTQLTKNSVTGTTSYYEYLPTINGTTVSSVIHVFGTEGNAITGISSQVDSLDTTRLAFSTSEGVTTVSAQSSATFTADYYVPMAINNSGTISLVSKIGIGGFSWNSSITSFNLPVTILEIAESAFLYCENLALISLPNGLTSIGKDAFEWCTSLQSISLPNSLIIDQQIFDYCSNLTTIIFDDNARYTSTDTKNAIIDKQTNTLIEVLVTASSLTLPDYVTSIGDWAVDLCTSLQSISLPEGLKSIGDAAFDGCTSLALTSLPNGITFIGANAFNGCTSLALTSLPEGLTSIDPMTFNGCTSLALTSLPNGITNISIYAFQNCTSLQTISLPSGLTSIDPYTFTGCTNLKTITFAGTKTQWETLNANNKAEFTTGAVVTCTSDGQTVTY